MPTHPTHDGSVRYGMYHVPNWDGTDLDQVVLYCTSYFSWHGADQQDTVPPSESTLVH